VVDDFYPTANGNWDAAMIHPMMAMGVFLDDRTIFGRAVDYYLHGYGNGAISNYLDVQGENRLLTGYEYTAKYNLGHDVPYEPYRICPERWQSEFPSWATLMISR